jgi:uncharacterized protein (DUF427 family)
MHPKPDPPRPGQESVWDYPRPAVAEGSSAHLKVVFAGVTVAETRAGVRTLETSHPPTWYFPPESVAAGVLVPAAGSSMCEWKGRARYFDVVAGGRRAEAAAWSYPAPTEPFRALAGYVAFYAAKMDACCVDGERVTPQPGGFYGGWVTSKLAGPFKGGPGTMGW